MSQIKQIKDATNLVEIIGERIQVQRSGANLRALCPFHSEKSPSFFINDQFQRYKCFGCGESGDVFTFLEKYEGMTFNESLKYLADRVGIQLEQWKPTHEEDRKERMLAILNLAKEYYHFLLTQHETGEPARQYLQERGTTNESIKIFQLGYALSAWDGLLTYLRDKKKYDEEDILATGLVIKGKTGRYYDRFRGRVMFPLTNHRGQVVGFSGRILNAVPAMQNTGGKIPEKEPKYINTPETSLYHKSQMLFGYSELYQEIRKKREVIVVEGEFDVISSAQAHVNHVVGIKGSALTTEHLRLMSRAADRILFALDTDAAGVEATKRAITLAQDTNLELRVIAIPEGKDPDELARHDPKTWREASKTSISIYEFLIQAALKKYDPTKPEGKRKIIVELAPILNAIALSVEQDYYLKKLATELHVKEELLRNDFVRLRDARKPLRFHDKPVEDKEDTVAEKEPEVKSRHSKLLEYALFLFFRSDSSQIAAKAKTLQEIGLSGHAKLLVEAAQSSSSQGAFELKQFIEQLPDDLQDYLFSIYHEPEFLKVIEKGELDKEWQKITKELNQEFVKTHITRITAELDELDQKVDKTPEDEQRQLELLTEVARLRKLKTT